MAPPKPVNDDPRRPRDLALLLLASSGESPRRRARDQQADRAGMELRRRVLDRLAELDPDPGSLEAALAEIARSMGEPSGPTRGVCSLIRQEWDQAQLSPGLWDWLRAEAVEASRGGSDRRDVVDLGPLRKLWPGGTGGEPTAELRTALADLDRLVVERPELSSPGRTLAGLLRASFIPPISPRLAWSDSEAIREAWGAGVPAFRAAPPPVDRAALRSRGVALCSALQSDNPRSSSFRAAIRRGKVDLRSWWDVALAGRPDAIERQAEELSLDPALALSALRLSLLPDLAASSLVVAPLLDEGAWRRGDCPHCGSQPTLAESRGLEGRRFLRCGLCAAEWHGDRLRCASCGETDSRALRSTYVEGQGDRFRLACCDRCGFTLRVVSTLAPLSPPGLLVTELATVHLDMIAQGLGPRD